LTGAAFCTDNSKVHGYLVSKLGTGPGAKWIANTLTTRNGRAAFQALTAHFIGAGNVSIQSATAEFMEATLHYKSEKGQVTWAEFLIRANKMFTIYEENHDPKVNSYKVGWLCKALHAQHLLDVGEEICKDRSRGREWQYDELCNYIGSCINSHDKMTIMGLGSRRVGAIHF
jgi:hypothetical protein